MATISQSSFLNVFFERKFFVLIQILPNIIAKDETVNKSELIKVMVWRQTTPWTDDDPVFEAPMRSDLCKMSTISSHPNVLTMR